MEKDYSKFVGYYIQNIARVFTHRHNTMLEQIGLTYSQFRILASLWRKEGQTQNDMVCELMIKPATLTGLLCTLERKGYLERKKSTEDGRIKFVFLTEKGRSLETVSYDIIHVLDTQIAQGVPDACKKKIVNCLSNLYNYSSKLELPELPESARYLSKQNPPRKTK